MIDERCDRCQEPTKRPVGLWDGAGGTHGTVWHCNSEDCPLAIEDRHLAAEAARRAEAARAANKSNAVDPRTIRPLYLRKRLILMDLARHFGTGASALSSYLLEREPFPPKLYWRITDYLEQLPDAEQDDPA